jgi:hypothetical protein
LREGCEHGVSVIPQFLHEADARSVIPIGGEILKGVGIEVRAAIDGGTAFHHGDVYAAVGKMGG